LFDGEEEIGSPSLSSFVTANKRALAADVAVMSDTRMLGPGRPALTYSLRGGLSLEINVHGPEQELHSGNFGGAIHNPVQALCEIVAKLHDKNGRVAIPGFYDRVRVWSDQERAFMKRNGPADEKILRDAKAKRKWGEHGYTLYERTTIRPALTLNGIAGGYQGKGGKSVIPAWAMVKINIRLVPDQDPHEIESIVREHIANITPSTVRSNVRTVNAGYPAVLDRNNPAMRAAARAYVRGFNRSPVLLRSGGSIPIVNTFQKTLGIPTVLMGFALPDDRIHAPNEKFHLPNLYRGIVTCLSFLGELKKAAINPVPETAERRAYASGI
jgi:acetylornithine deacetylase/succinyl-diaminopimelate desuccinylase-like protein